MSNWNTQWFLVIQARERQQHFLHESELDHAVHNAQKQQLETRYFGLRAWITRSFKFRPSTRALGR